MTIQRVHNHDLDPTCRETRGSNGLLRGECLTAEYEATDADLDAIADEKVTQPAPAETTAELLRRLTKERNEARALLETRALGVHPDCHNDAVKRGDNLHKRALRAEAERDALAAKMGRVEALVDTYEHVVSIRFLRAALADADATAASPSGLDDDAWEGSTPTGPPGTGIPAERPTPATTEKCIADTCCGKCAGPCYVDQVTGA